jgi:hypothetical protein
MMPDGSMNKTLKKDLIQELKKAQRFINRQDSQALKILSDETIKNASAKQDPESISLAVAIYAISKLLDRRGYETEYADELRNLLGMCQFALDNNETNNYDETLKKLFEFIGSVEKEFKGYVEKVIEKAEIKKGSRLYEQGISLGKAAELMGIGQWELMSYLGKTVIPEETGEKMDVRMRLDLARSFFQDKK